MYSCYNPWLAVKATMEKKPKEDLGIVIQKDRLIDGVRLHIDQQMLVKIEYLVCTAACGKECKH